MRNFNRGRIPQVASPIQQEEEKVHEASQTKEQEQQTEETTRKDRRHMGYFVFACFPKTLEAPELLSFPGKTEMRAHLDQDRYRGAELRVIRGYEMQVKARVSVTVA